MSKQIVMVASRHGFVFQHPWFGVHGNAEVLLKCKKYGFIRSDEVFGRRHMWLIYLGKEARILNDPGDIITEETLDPEMQRVTRMVQFRGEAYFYYSGVRVSYRKNHPEKKEVTAIWMPDAQYKDNPAICSMGIQADIVETLKLMWELGNEMRNLPKD